jgi:hypothetical protein
VDLVEKSILKPRIGKHILGEVVNLWSGILDYVENIIEAMEEAMSFVKNMDYGIL